MTAAAAAGKGVSRFGCTEPTGGGDHGFFDLGLLALGWEAVARSVAVDRGDDLAGPVAHGRSNGGDAILQFVDRPRQPPIAHLGQSFLQLLELLMECSVGVSRPPCA